MPKKESAAKSKPIKKNGFRGSVRIRMYRQGIGDAFLLSFNNKNEKASHILIDCGVLTGTPDSKKWMEDIAEDVSSSTGQHINAIIGTHAHWDHLSGFYYAIKKFEENKVDEVWLSWAENPRDSGGLSRKRKEHMSLVQNILTKLKVEQDLNRATAVQNVLSFYGVDDQNAMGVDGSSRTDQALEALRALVKKPDYLEPGDLIEREWLPGVRIYVFGPPRDEKFLGKMLGKVDSEMYGFGSDEGSLTDSMLPFDASLCWSMDEAKKISFFKENYFDGKNKSRWIDNVWLQSAESLSLQLDRVVNNTSLVLAVELVDSGDVMLFAADAQIGNWLSWDSLSWQIKDKDGRAKKITSSALLAQTVFYKVGHHGSHNATLVKGLDAMTHPDLVASIPVNQQFANNKKKWDMPATSLLPHLIKKTEGRILRSDGKPLFKKPFDKRIKENEATPSLYIDYILP